ncbi:44565_t:CDS:2 [Gigaspora margarita]|uniref:44565_t:CDS:1 n=1 Tax=Gigaspora margarita TaxID=4874 RepID=A0ABM8W2U0_GIGMA|nr:44565_t:CDS:2 [Gigaspora margarita]
MEPNVFAEILPNVRSMNLNVGLPTEKTRSSLKLGIYPLRITLELKNKSTTQCPLTTLNLSQTIETDDKPIITTSQDSLDIRLKLRSYVRKKPAKQLSAKDILPPFSASELTKLKNIQCGYCKIPLLKTDTFSKIMDMPSEHWAELIECWMCHQEDYPQARMNDIIVREHIGLVGNTYLLIHPKDVKNDALEIGERLAQVDWTKGLSKKWRPLNCNRCLCPIGEGLYQKMEGENDASELSLLAIKFHKHAIFIELESDTNELITQRYPFSAFIIADLFEAAKAHATYRFIIEGQNSNQSYALIWLFGWDTKVITNALQGESQCYNKFSPNVAQFCVAIKSDLKPYNVVRLLYIDCTPTNNDKSSSLLEQWQKDKTVEHLVYHNDICLQILLMLKISTSCLPFSKRTMNGFSVGFIDIL